MEKKSNINFVLVFRPLDFLECSEPLDLKGNETARQDLGYGCTKVSDWV